MANVNEQGSVPQGTGRLSDTDAPGLSGIETVDLSVANPTPTAHLALTEHDSKRMALPGTDASRCLKPGGYLQFNLTLSYQHGAALILELCSTEPTEPEVFSLDIEVNDVIMKPALPHNDHFYNRSWYLMAEWLKTGENLITIKLPAEAETPILFKSVSVMRFNLEAQKHTLWCWASVTAAVQQFFDPDCTVTQDEVVQKCLQHTNNVIHDLDKALKKVGLLVCSHEAVPALGEIRKQLSAGLPVPVRIGWTKRKDNRRELSGNGHFVVITGVLQRASNDDDTFVRVSDPKNGMASYLPYRNLKNSYTVKKGLLTHFYVLKRREESSKQARKETTS